MIMLELDRHVYIIPEQLKPEMFELMFEQFITIFPLSAWMAIPDAIEEVRFICTKLLFINRSGIYPNKLLNEVVDAFTIKTEVITVTFLDRTN